MFAKNGLFNFLDKNSSLKLHSAHEKNMNYGVFLLFQKEGQGEFFNKNFPWPSFHHEGFFSSRLPTSFS